MQKTFTLLLLLIGTFLSAQTISDFEDITLPAESFLNGSDGSDGFTSGNSFLPSNYNPMFMSWSSWAISNTTDVVTPGPANQYSAITGSGENSSNYAVSFIFEPVIIKLEGMAAGEVVNGFSITNATYTYLSMLNGDMFAKKFGGVSGNDPDFYFLTVKKYLDGVISTDSVDFYLADYRFEDNSMDYIVDEWTYVDLSSLGQADSLVFTLSSSDSSPAFGLNTPAYFCVDNIITSDGTTSVSDLASPALFEVFPNPASDYIIFKNLDNKAVNAIIYDMLGNQVYTDRIFSDQQQIDISSLPQGTYIIEVQDGETTDSQLLIKQ